MTVSLKMDPYIAKLSHTSVEQIRPRNGLKFIAKLERSYGTEKVVKAISSLLNQPNHNFSGVKDFKERVTKAIVGTCDLSGADQVYILKYVQSI